MKLQETEVRGIIVAKVLVIVALTGSCFGPQSGEQSSQSQTTAATGEDKADSVTTRFKLDYGAIDAWPSDTEDLQEDLWTLDVQERWLADNVRIVLTASLEDIGVDSAGYWVVLSTWTPSFDTVYFVLRTSPEIASALRPRRAFSFFDLVVAVEIARVESPFATLVASAFGASPDDLYVELDPSSASYFVAAGTLIGVEAVN